MKMSNVLFNALFNAEFYKDNKSLISRNLFADSARDLYDTVVWAYNSGVTELNVNSLKILHLERNPAETEARQQLIDIFLKSLTDAEPVTQEVAALALKEAKITLRCDEAARLLSQYGERDFDTIRNLLNDAERLRSNEKDADTVDMDVSSLLERTAQNCKWTFNLSSLAELVPGIGPSTLTLMAGRVESGKTALAISTAYGINGFADQGANILHVVNEEDAGFTGIRAVSCYADMTKAEIMEAKELAAQRFAGIRNRIRLINSSRLTMGQLEKLVDRHRPDIVIVDILDHMQIAGEYARDDQRLGQLYRQAREIAKIYQLAFIGVSQTSAESAGKLYYTFDSLAGSKTEKPGALDVCLLVGANPPDDSGSYSLVRAINVAKNKIGGKHGAVTCMIEPSKSKFVP